MTRRPLAVGGLILVTLIVADTLPPVPLAPVLQLRKTVSVDGACPGADTVVVRAASSVTYCYTVTNTGPMEVRNIVVRDAGRSMRVGALAGGQSRTVARAAATTPEPVTAGEASVTTEPVAGGGVDVLTPPPAGAATAPGDDGCHGVEVTTAVDGTAETVTACYAFANAGETAADSTGDSPSATAPMTSPAPPAPGFVRLGSTPAAATTLQSP